MTLPTVLESQFEDKIVAYARLTGWHVHVERPARTNRGWRTPIKGHPGFPDLVLARAETIVFAELKADHGRITVDQARWLESIDTGWDLGMPAPGTRGVVAVCWRPKDWPTIEAFLGYRPPSPTPGERRRG